MRTKAKTIVKEIAITQEEKEILTKIYQLAITIHEERQNSFTCFSTTLDMLMSDLIDAEQYNDEFIIGLDEYYL